VPRQSPRRIATTAVGVLAAVFVLLGALPPSVAADEGLTIEAHALLQGHVRSGSWFAVAVDMSNSGPAVTGELRIAGGVDSRTRFVPPVELATGSASSTSCTPCRPPSAAT